MKTISAEQDPWDPITRPSVATALAQRLVDASSRWDFYWAKDSSDSCLLVLRVPSEIDNPESLPQLHEIELSLQDAPSTPYKLLLMKLKDNSQRPLFRVLCEDIVKSSASATTPDDALHTALRRTWRWHRLLRRGKAKQLSEEEQKGLIGELSVLELLLHRAGPGVVVSGWKGPFGAPKDFELGTVLIESKARRNASTPFVRINSEFQLDIPVESSLFLHVANLLKSSDEDLNAFDLNQLVRTVTFQIGELDPGLVDPFENALSASGYLPDDDYSEWKWLRGTSTWYAVDPDFPRIASSLLPNGVSRVNYDLALNACADFEVGAEEVWRSISGAL